YIPLRFYRVGTSFGNDSVWCVNTFRDITDRKNDQVAELRHTAATTPQLPPICPNEEILNVLDDYNYKHHPNVLDERSGLGRTFGNICRSCSVCSHKDKNYGAYLSKKHKMEKGQEQIKEHKETLIA
ncbi:putative protein C10orf82, partial [Ophiophagus hannah]